MGFFKGFPYFCDGNVQRYFQQILKLEELHQTASLSKSDLRDD